MRFTRLIPAIGAIPELYSYYCDSCGEALTEVGKPGGRRDLLALSEIDRAASRPIDLDQGPRSPWTPEINGSMMSFAWFGETGP
jgi:hypothetical protein